MLWILDHELEVTAVVASSDTGDFAVEGYLIHPLDDTLATSEYGRIMVEEVDPVVDVIPEGDLVSDVADDDGLLLLVVASYTTQGLCDGDRDCSLSLAGMEHQTIEEGIL